MPPPKPKETEPAGRRIEQLEHRLADLQMRISTMEDLVGALMRLCGVPDSERLAWRQEAQGGSLSAYRFQGIVNTLVARLEERDAERRRLRRQRIEEQQRR